MKQFQYTVKDPLGIHARPAALLAAAANAFTTATVTVTKDGQTVRASQLMRLMDLAVKQDDTVTVTADGPAEVEAIAMMQRFFEENL